MPTPRHPDHPKGEHHHTDGTTCCRQCGRVWASKSQCHCTKCHRQFGGVRGFDSHHRHGECLSDRSLGRINLVRKDDAYGPVWRKVLDPGVFD